MEKDLEEYILAHSDPEGDYLYKLYRDTNVYLLHGRMASGHLQGRILKMLVRMIRPRRILEIGTFSGYSALCLAEGFTGGEGILHTFEINDELEDFTRPRIENSPLASHIRLHFGDIFEELPALGENFDLAFIDADKRQYVDYYELCLKHLRPGGFILADNTLWDGHVTDPAYSRDAQTRGIRRFNDYVAADKRVEKVILPLRDGLTLICKKPENPAHSIQ
ncbi:MAG: O-methyltransferase [Bacteroidaceae bacterium]|jgi:caffeoyl-CoA O-methyltransferase